MLALLQKQATVVVLALVALGCAVLTLHSEPEEPLVTERSDWVRTPQEPEPLGGPPPAPGGVAAAELRRAARTGDAVAVHGAPIALELFDSLRRASTSLRDIALTTHRTSARDAVERVARGEAELAVVTTPETESERGLGLACKPLGEFVPVVIVHARNPLRDIRRADLRRVLRGAVADWSHLGGHAGPIRLLRPPAGPRSDRIASLLIPGDGLGAGQDCSGDAAIVASVAGDESALGVVPMAAVGESAEVVVLTVDGARPDDRTHYPARCTLRLVYRAGHAAAVDRLLEFADGRRGRNALSEVLCLR